MAGGLEFIGEEPVAELGIVAMGLGAGLFATAFETETTGVPPAIEEEQVVDTGRAVAGAVLMAAGFGVAIGGIAFNPTHAERARAQTARYVFVPGPDDREAVVRLVAEHNDGLRAACERGDRAPRAEEEPAADTDREATPAADEAPSDATAPEDGEDATPDDAADEP